MKKALIGTALVIGMIGAAVAATHCNSFPSNVATGNVTVIVNPGDLFKGSVEEYGAGSVLATVNGFFEGSIAELDVGNLETRGAGTFKGNSDRALPGSGVNSIADFQGAACKL